MIRRRSFNDLWWVGLGFITFAAIMLGAMVTHHAPANVLAAAPPNTVVVYKSPTCSCCSKWIEHLQQAGFRVEVHNESEMGQIKKQLGIPKKLASCHTAIINGYLIEGHVPAEDIRQLLTQRPKAKGLIVPGMPVGSPGMEVGTRVDPYDVMLVADGQAPATFAHHGPANTP